MAFSAHWALLAMALLAGVSFFFALAEAALFSLGKWRTRQLAETTPVPGRHVLELLQEPQELLATIAFGNTLTNAGLIGTAVWLALRGQWPIAWTAAGTLTLVIIMCEVVPKTLALRRAERWALRVVRPMALLQRYSRRPREWVQAINNTLLHRIVPQSWQPQPTLTDEEYLELFELACQQGALAHSERDILVNLIQLDRRSAKDAMKPRAILACLRDDSPIEEMIAAAKRFKHRRLPLYDETPDTIVGILNTRTLLADSSHDLESAIEFPSFVPESMNLLLLFKSMQRQERGMAIVLDEFGGTAGMVTMEDILEQVIGEIRAEGESRGFIMERMKPDQWRVSGTMRLDDFRREYPGLPETPGIETMGGLLVHRLGVVPVAGESAVVDPLRLTALAVDERRVLEVRVELLKKRRAPATER